MKVFDVHILKSVLGQILLTGVAVNTCFSMEEEDSAEHRKIPCVRRASIEEDVWYKETTEGLSALFLSACEPQLSDVLKSLYRNKFIDKYNDESGDFVGGIYDESDHKEAAISRALEYIAEKYKTT
ncbi:MAG: hypothetical protein V4482_03940 [Pseudomonadota bacterium]